MLAADSWQQIAVVPRPGEMVLAGQRPGCILRVIGIVNGACWVETSSAPYGIVQGILHDTGRSRMWAVRPYGPG